jgi:hypothetical protein
VMSPSKSDFVLLDLTIHVTSYCLTRFIFRWNDFFVVSSGTQGCSLTIMVLMVVLLGVQVDTAPKLSAASL